jgi:hypothetical protein
MSTQPAPAVHASRRSRYWVHAVPAVLLMAVFLVAGSAGSDAFTLADSDSSTRPAAPFQAIAVWMVWFFPLATVGTFLTLLAYLLVLPARSRGLWITQIVLTSLAAVVSVLAVLVMLWMLPGM